VAFSVGGPFAVEVWQAIPGTPLAMPEWGYVHHIGYWVDDVDSEGQRLENLGYPTVVTSGTSPLLNRGPGGLLLEPCGLQIDRPSLRDLFPQHSRYAGEPVYSSPL
jgi:hypothetical protein